MRSSLPTSSRITPIPSKAAGPRLPFPDRAFDVVLTVDTLEHVPPALRHEFIGELVRVADSYVVITGPFASSVNLEAEQLLREYLLEMLGMRYPFLLEHVSWYGQS